jgi:hypothetical protein
MPVGNHEGDVNPRLQGICYNVDLTLWQDEMERQAILLQINDR